MGGHHFGISHVHFEQLKRFEFLHFDCTLCRTPRIYGRQQALYMQAEQRNGFSLCDYFWVERKFCFLLPLNPFFWGQMDGDGDRILTRDEL